APSYLSTELQRVADVDSRRRLRSASTTALVVPRTQHSKIGDRAFPVAAGRVWNSLPLAVTLFPSLPTFKRRLKTELFVRSYSDAQSTPIDRYSRCCVFTSGLYFVTLKFIGTMRLR